jgi:proteasome lid subunit RPN8/RPN11
MSEEKDEITLKEVNSVSGGGDDAASADQPSVRLLLAESALQAMNQHAASESRHEIGGVMVGRVWEGPQPVVFVEDIIRGTHMSHLRSSVTFTHESWAAINQAMDEQYADKAIVGWYHSHPGFGIFLSDHDLFIHRNFFTMPWQVAFVTDPVKGSHGCFTWNNGDLAEDKEWSVYHNPSKAVSAVPPVETQVAEKTPEGLPVAQLEAQPLPARPTESGSKVALGLVAVLIGLVLALNIVGLQQLNQFRTRWERDYLQIQQILQAQQRDELPATLLKPEPPESEGESSYLPEMKAAPPPVPPSEAAGEAADTAPVPASPSPSPAPGDSAAPGATPGAQPSP